MDSLFKDKVALVTGGSSGIGSATALAFAAHGARVVVAGRRADETAETARLIQAEGGSAISFRTDVSRSSEVEALVAHTVDHSGALNFAFNNAGIEGDAFVPLEKYAEATWDVVIDINLKGVFLCMKFELPHIIASKGAIVNMASVAGLSGGRLGAAYFASKHGVVGLTKAAALEYADKGVRINAVAPAIIATPMAERAFFHDEALRFPYGPSDRIAPFGAFRFAGRGCQRGNLARLAGRVLHDRPHPAHRWRLPDLMSRSRGPVLAEPALQ
jgi:NAD(P)-dependent dehydrogenase (short-subunit alcohol dehydrogenase family)